MNRRTPLCSPLLIFNQGEKKMKTTQKKSEASVKKGFIKVKSDFRCGLSKAEKIEQFRKGFLKKG